MRLPEFTHSRALPALPPDEVDGQKIIFGLLGTFLAPNMDVFL